MNKINLKKISFKPYDADIDKNLIEYFIPYGNFEKLLNGELFIVSGIKGSGKSAIKIYISENRKKNNQLTICLDRSSPSYNIQLSDFKASSSYEIENKIKGYLSGIILQYVLNSPLINGKDKSRLTEFKNEIPLIKRIIESVKLKPPFAEIAIKEIFPKKKKGELLKLINKSFIEEIKKILGNKDIWILFDDVDKVFISDDNSSSLEFIKGLICAVRYFNNEYQKIVNIVILLRSEIYEELKVKFEELDKIRDFIWEIEWKSEDLQSLLSERIKWNLKNYKEQKDWKCWMIIFNVKNENQTIKYREYIIERLINGPRDLLYLVESAKENAILKGRNKISLSHIKEIESDYGNEKLLDVTRNYQRKYEDIIYVIDRLFRGTCQVYKRVELENQINKKILTNSYARDDFKHLRWLNMCTPYNFIEILYKIGVIGYWNSRKRRYIYSLERSKPEEIIFNSGNIKLIIHSAFKEHLSLKNKVKYDKE